MSKVRNAPGRALTARSVLLSVLLGSQPPRLPVALLVRTTELFGIGEGTTRTALSRMVAAGELAAVEGAYELVGAPLLARQRRQRESRSAEVRPWDGAWRQGVVGTGSRRGADERAAVRATLRGRRFAELREGVWLRPDNLPEPDNRPGPDTGPGSIEWFSVRPQQPGATLASRLWDLGGWASVAGDLRARMDSLVGPLEAGDRTTLADGFVVSADVLRHFQADPLLPVELLPADWPGRALRHDYDRYDEAYRSVLRDWFAEARSVR